MTTKPQSGVIVLDTDERHAQLLVQKLTTHGVKAHQAAHSDEALDLARSGNYSVLLSEIWMPEKTGFEIAHQLREEKITSPEIILMSSDTKVSLFECHQAGASYFIKKPINMDELGLALKRFGNISQFDNGMTSDSNATLNRLYGQIRVPRQKQEVPVEVSNLGRGGFFAKTAPGIAALGVGQIVDFNLRLNMVPNCECQGRGIIRWNYQATNSAENGVGIEFLKVPDWFHQLAFSFADLFKVKEYIPNM